MGTPLKHILEVFKRFKKQCYSNVTPGRRKQSSCSFTDEPVTAHSHLQHMSDDLPLLSPIFPFRLVAQGALSFISTGPEPKMNFQPSRRVGSGLHLRVITYSYALCVCVCVFPPIISSRTTFARLLQLAVNPDFQRTVFVTFDADIQTRRVVSIYLNQRGRHLDPQ